MSRLAALAAKYQIDILGPLPEYASPEGSAQLTDRELIEELRSAHVAALNAGNAEALVDVFAEDAVQMPPNAPANAGKTSIRAWAKAFLDAFRVKFTLSVTELQIAGDRAIESGAYTIALTPAGDGQSLQDKGKYITVYKRSSTGGWAVARDIWNSDHSPA
jgi:uncharacterized protein (TIGR02246 family)